MGKNAEYYKNLLNLEPVKCNGWLQVVYDQAPQFNFAYYLLEKGIICPWHTMGSTESCHYVDGDEMFILCMKKNGKKWEPELTRLNRENRDFFILPGTWCTFFLSSPKHWSLITHFHFPSYEENLTLYATPDQFKDLFPNYAILGDKYGLTYQFNKKERTSAALS